MKVDIIIAVIILLLSACCLDSNSFIPAIICMVSLVYLMLRVKVYE